MGRTLVLNRNSLSVKLESEHLVIHDHADARADLVRVPLVEVERVVVLGQPAITFPVMAKLMDERIPCSFLTGGGRWRGLMDGDSGFHAGRRHRQYESLSNDEFTMRFAARVLESKLKNSRRTLQRLAANRNMSLDGCEDFSFLTKCQAALPTMRTVGALRGLEGSAAAAYFHVLAQFFPKTAPFVCRTRRPPRNIANALLSFVYMLLLNEVVSGIRAHGLDVAAGYFHRERDRSPALALDLMEPYRPAFADRLVLDLLNHGRIRAADHAEHKEGDGVFLTEVGRKIVFKAFDEGMERRIERGFGRLTMRQQIDKDICSFIAMLEHGEMPCFFRAA